MTTRQIAGEPVSALGLGCMGMSYAYGPADDAESLRTLHRGRGMTSASVGRLHEHYERSEVVTP